MKKADGKMKEYPNLNDIKTTLNKTKRKETNNQIPISNKEISKKLCLECKEIKPLTDFNITESGKRYRPFCRACEGEIQLNSRKKVGKIINQDEPVEEVQPKKAYTKVCSKCKQEKSKNEFGSNRQNGDRKDNFCRPCRKQATMVKNMEESEQVYDMAKDVLINPGGATAKEIKKIIPDRFHSRIYNILNMMVEEGKLRKWKEHGVNLYASVDTTKNIVKEFEKVKQEASILPTEIDTNTNIKIQIQNTDFKWTLSMNIHADIKELQKDIQEIVYLHAEG
jgi:hypothetical protein